MRNRYEFGESSRRRSELSQEDPFFYCVHICVHTHIYTRIKVCLSFNHPIIFTVLWKVFPRTRRHSLSFSLSQPYGKFFSLSLSLILPFSLNFFLFFFFFLFYSFLSLFSAVLYFLYLFIFFFFFFSFFSFSQ